MSAHDPRPAAMTGAPWEGSVASVPGRTDVTEWGCADLYGFAPPDAREWRRRGVRLSLWLVAAVISLLANAEMFMLLTHRDFGADAGVADPAVVMIDLPASATPAEPAQPPSASPQPPAEAPAKAPAKTLNDTAPPKTASREPEDAAPPPDVVAPPIEAAPLPLVRAPDDRAAVPLPVARPHERRRLDIARAVVRPASRKTMKTAVAAQSVAGRAPRREARSTPIATPSDAPSEADWKSRVVAALNHAKHYPDGTQAIGSPTIRIMVAASGDVARVAIVASSGSDLLDTAAIETVRRTSPLPPPPSGPTGLTFRMNFHLRSP